MEDSPTKSVTSNDQSSLDTHYESGRKQRGSISTKQELPSANEGSPPPQGTRSLHNEEDNIEVRWRRIHSNVLKAKYVNYLSATYFAKCQFFFIFLPLQLLSIWTAISGTVSAHSSATNTAPVEYNDDQINDMKPSLKGNVVVVSDAHMLRRAIADGVVGALLLIVTNINRKLNLDVKAQEHSMVAKRMDALDMSIDLICGECDSLAITMKNEKMREIEEEFMKSVENTNHLSPPTKIMFAFDKLEFAIDVRSSTMGKHKNLKLANKTYDIILKRAYSDLGSLLEDRVSKPFLPQLHPDTVVSTVIKRLDSLFRDYEEQAERGSVASGMFDRNTSTKWGFESKREENIRSEIKARDQEEVVTSV